MNEQRPEEESRAPLAFATLVGVLALCVGLVAMGLGLFGATRTVRASDDSNPAAAAGAVTEADVTLHDIYVSPKNLDIKPGAVITLRVKNEGAAIHDLALDGIKGTKKLAPGASETIKVGPFTKDAVLWCTVAGHKDAGMALTLHAGSSANAVTASASSRTLSNAT